jgi:CheY-like chemotaxis protein
MEERSRRTARPDAGPAVPQQAPDRVPAPAGLLPPRAARRVLIVEADAFARRALAQILRGQGYAATTAANPREALRRLRWAAPPALILLNHRPPAADGWEFCARRRHEPRLAHVPVVVVSADAAPPPDRAAALGIAGFLRKPLAVDELLSTIARCC